MTNPSFTAEIAVEMAETWAIDGDGNTDDATPEQVLTMLAYCASLWEPGVRLIGDVRACDIERSCRQAVKALNTDRNEIIEQCAVAAEAQDRVNREWVRDSLWDAICKRAGANVRKLKNAANITSEKNDGF